MHFENNQTNTFDINMEQSMPNNQVDCRLEPIFETPEERVCHRYMCYEVPHIKPCNTKIINHHIYRHTFTPMYTCCEENVCENVFDRMC